MRREYGHVGGWPVRRGPRHYLDTVVSTRTRAWTVTGRESGLRSPVERERRMDEQLMTSVLGYPWIAGSPFDPEPLSDRRLLGLLWTVGSYMQRDQSSWVSDRCSQLDRLFATRTCTAATLGSDGRFHLLDVTQGGRCGQRRSSRGDVFSIVLTPRTQRGAGVP
ncbi:hypothetical protein AUCHE_04_00360 [Austwickia chelonae NBRC 105200]|uniref:Uncharacterized protein n=1 Tax=Austwickia chelonae NBRC 105200 TaxID=1184607 RepID=K6UL76_9MICO|nr:hypothetical protein AUCHE_04_00360 [Austwickia chelonae NBRC 105200]